MEGFTDRQREACKDVRGKDASMDRGKDARVDRRKDAKIYRFVIYFVKSFNTMQYKPIIISVDTKSKSNLYLFVGCEHGIFCLWFHFFSKKKIAVFCSLLAIIVCIKQTLENKENFLLPICNT